MRLLILAALAASVSVGEALQSKSPATQDATQSSVAQSSVQYFIQVVQDGADCIFTKNTLPMCARKEFVCRMEPGHEMFATAPSCLAYDPTNMKDNPFKIEESAIAPWDVCDPAAELTRQIGDPPVCQRSFNCRCLHGVGNNCFCVPPDAVDDVSGAAACSNGTVCTEDKYCHYRQEGGIECGQKPYYS